MDLPVSSFSLDAFFEALPDVLVPPVQRATIRQLGATLPASAFTGSYGLELRLGLHTENRLTDFACLFARRCQNMQDLYDVRLSDHFDDVTRYRNGLAYLQHTKEAGLGQLADEIWLEFDATDAGFHRAPGLFFYLTPEGNQAWTETLLHDQIRTALDRMPGFDADTASGLFYREAVRTVIQQGRIKGTSTVQMAWLFGRDCRRMRLCMRLQDPDAVPDLLGALDLDDTAQATHEALAPYKPLMQGSGLTLNVGTDIAPRIGTHLAIFRRGPEGRQEAERWMQVLVTNGHATPEEAEALLHFHCYPVAPIDPDHWPPAFKQISNFRYGLVAMPQIMHLKLVVAPSVRSTVKAYIINSFFWHDAFTRTLLPLRALVPQNTIIEPAL